MGPGDLVRIKVPPALIGGILHGAPVWDTLPWRGTSVMRWQLPEDDLLLVLEHTLRVACDPESGAARVLSPTSGITGWVMDAYLDALELAEILTDVEVV